MRVNFEVANLCAPKTFQNLKVNLSNNVGTTVVKNVKLYYPHNQTGNLDINNATLIGTYTAGNNFTLPHTAVFNIPPNHQSLTTTNTSFFVVAEIDYGTTCGAYFQADFLEATLTNQT
jgi:hypothetical protein